MHVIESPTREFRSFIGQQEYWQKEDALDAFELNFL